MPIHYQQALEQIRNMGQKARLHQAWLEALREQAWQLLHELAGEGEYLNTLAERGGRFNPGLRCALAGAEPLDTAAPLTVSGKPRVLLAADGSQINPGRHGAVEFIAINVGAVCFRPGEPPREQIHTSLRFGEDCTIDRRPMSDADVAIWRDLEERRLLMELAHPHSQAGQLVVTLTDGPLQLFGQGQESKFFEEKLKEYLGVLRELAEPRTAAAGYVDKPRSDYLVGLLELALLARENKLGEAGRERPLWPVRDRDLFARLLGPGERSAVLAMRLPEPNPFTDKLALYCFYLNVGRAGHAQIARVEVPRWVAEEPVLLNLLQEVLVEQSAQLGARPYPYLLHRAHEVAVVHPDEIEEIERMIQAELRRQGVEPENPSNKQWAKELQGRTRINA